MHFVSVLHEKFPTGRTGYWTKNFIELRARLETERPEVVLDFYEPPLKERWSGDQIIKTLEGEVAITVPSDEHELEEKETVDAKAPETRQSIRFQAKLARIGNGFQGFDTPENSAARGWKFRRNCLK